MTPLHLSTGDASGGAARAAYRVHVGLRRLGVDSSMLVLRHTTGDPTVRQIKFHGDWPTKFRRRARAKRIPRDFDPYRKTLPAGFELFSDDRSKAGYDLNRQIGSPDLINLHWVAGLVDYELFFRHLPAGVPLVWRLADMGALTGGCHYDRGCGKFAAACGACPILGSDREDDLSRQSWRRRRDALAAVPDSRMTLVATSRWIAAESRKSSLVGRFPVVIIPNALDTDEFVPRDKNFCRDLFGVPRDKKVVLFVADSTENKRKGFDYLAAALSGLKGRDDLHLISVGNKVPVVPGLPVTHVGRINNDLLLSTVYSAADLFVIPSLQESFGQTVIESMACGVPVVGFDAGGIPDMVRPGETGRLAPTGDADDLRHQIGTLLDDPAARARMAVRCRDVAVAEYSLAVQSAAYYRLYQAILRPHPK